MAIMTFWQPNGLSQDLFSLSSIRRRADRLLMALTGLGIRETILFPLVKPRA